MGLQGVPAAVRHDIQVQGQGEAHQLHLLPGQENAGEDSLVMVEKVTLHGIYVHVFKFYCPLQLFCFQDCILFRNCNVMLSFHTFLTVFFFIK